MKLFINKEDVITKVVEDDEGNEFEIRLRHSTSPHVKAYLKELYCVQGDNDDKAKQADNDKNRRAQYEVISAMETASNNLYASFIESWTIDIELTHELAVTVVDSNKELKDFIDAHCYEKEKEYNAKKNNS